MTEEQKSLQGIEIMKGIIAIDDEPIQPVREDVMPSHMQNGIAGFYSFARTLMLSAMLSLVVAPQLARADTYCCCIKLEGESAKCDMCKEYNTWHSWAWTKCVTKAYSANVSSSLYVGRCCNVEACSDYPCGNETGPVANIQWWHDKDFKGQTHRRNLYAFEYEQCLRLVHNDAMKSIKFWGKPGQKLEIYDDPECKTSDDWGVLKFSAGASVVSLPKIGKNGEDEVSPRGAYIFHYHNGLPGKVSAIRISQ